MSVVAFLKECQRHMYLFCSSYAYIGDVELTARELYDKILKISF